MLKTLHKPKFYLGILMADPSQSCNPKHLPNPSWDNTFARPSTSPFSVKWIYTDSPGRSVERFVEFTLIQDSFGTIEICVFPSNEPARLQPHQGSLEHHHHRLFLAVSSRVSRLLSLLLSTTTISIMLLHPLMWAVHSLHLFPIKLPWWIPSILDWELPPRLFHPFLTTTTTTILHPALSFQWAVLLVVSMPPPEWV